MELPRLRRLCPSEDQFTESLTLEQAANRWRESQDGVRDDTAQNRHYVLNSFRDHIGEQVYEPQVSANDCESWIYHSGKSGWTKRNYYSRLDAFFSWCIKAEHLKENPLEGVARPRKPSTDEPQWLNREEVDQVQIAIQRDYEDRIKKYNEGAAIWTLRRN